MEISRAFNLYMEYCRSKQLRQRTMLSYEQTIKLFIRWLKEVEGIDQIEQIKEVTIRHYILELQSRGNKGLTQEQLANIVSVSRSTVSHWETGRKGPEKELLDRLEQVLEVEFVFDQEVEEEELLEKPIESREVPSAEEDLFVIRKSPEKQVSLKMCIAAIVLRSCDFSCFMVYLAELDEERS